MDAIVKNMAKNKTVVKIAKKLLRLKKRHPFWYNVLGLVTDGMILGTFILVSVGLAFWMTIEGYCTFDSALIGLAMIDLNLVLFSYIKTPVSNEAEN